ncbi:MAG: lipid-binding SYLF domain-containing protein [Psychromonas sp.]
MKKWLFLCISLFFSSFQAFADEDTAKTTDTNAEEGAEAAEVEEGGDANIDESQATVSTFKKLEQTTPFFEEAYGYAVFPTIGKGGFGIGGAYGEGHVYLAGEPTGVVKMGQVTFGFQVGGQAFSQIVFLQDKRAYDAFTSGSFEFGAQASAVALTYGASAQAGTTGSGATAGEKQAKARYVSGFAVFTLAKGGLMYEASLGGQKFSFTPNE